MADPTKTTATGGSAPATNAPLPVAGGADQLLAKHGSDKHDFKAFGSLPPKPGALPRGRPPKNGLPPKSTVPPAPIGKPFVDPAQTAPASGDGLPSVPIDPALVRKSIEVVIEGIEGIAVSRVTTKATKVFPPGDARLLGEGMRCPKQSKEVMAATLPMILDEWGVSSRHIPKMAFVAGFGMWMAGVTETLSKLDGMIAEKDGKEAAAALAAKGAQQNATSN